MLSITVISKMDSPRRIKKIRLNKHRVHGRKPIMIYIQEMNRYWCECGNYIKPSNKEEHEKL